jgi:hypothetical protein
VKTAIEKSVSPLEIGAPKPSRSGESADTLRFSSMSKAGGVINAYEAIRIADALSKSKSIPEPKEQLPKSTIKKTSKG